MTADGAAAVETLRAELARAKEQARRSNAAALKAAEELPSGLGGSGEILRDDTSGSSAL